MTSEETPYFCAIPNRGLIHLEGADRHDFLQGLVTNDVAPLKEGRAVYACLLTPQGKFLHDFFMVEGDGFTLLDCEGGDRARDLYKKLNLYRLRAKITVSVEENVPVYAVFGSDGTGFADPRHTALGRRIFEKPQGVEEKPFAVRDETRLRLGIPDGSRDMIAGQDTLLECNIDRFNGVSFEKGCYVGQEVTARMKHRGLVKNRLFAVQCAGPAPAFGSDVTVDGVLAGQMRSSRGSIGLAMLKIVMTGRMQDGPVRLLNPEQPPV